MKVSDFNYELPKELIAQAPIKCRDESRLMVLDKNNNTIEHKTFKNIIEYLEPGDCLVRNNTKVIPARLYGIKEETGAHVEFLLLKRLEGDIWEVMVRPGKKLRPGTKVIFGEGLFETDSKTTRNIEKNNENHNIKKILLKAEILETLESRKQKSEI